MIRSPHLVHPGRAIRLSRLSTGDTVPFAGRQQAEEATAEALTRLAHLQGVLYAEGRRSVLIVLQGMDTSGKDGAIRSVFSGVNPQGCAVASFKAPSAEELAHDFLWRIHAHAPARGMITIFNRSHYESVLVERVHGLVPRAVWSERYEHINAFEKMLAAEGTTILKFFLHISKREQKQRLERRLADPERNWKFDARDLEERKLWAKYQAAYEDALQRCSTEQAPWYVVPADNKWFRNWVIADVIVRTMEGMKLRYPPAPKGVEKWKVR